MAWESRIVGHGEAAPGDLVGNPRNWRTHPKAQRDALAGVLDQVGWVQDVIVNKRTGYLVDGHARVAVAAQRGETSVPVVYVDLSEDEELLILATLDPLAAMAEADTDALADLLAAITSEDAALTSMLDALAKAEGIDTAVDGLTDPDDVPDERETTVQRGDVYQLGRHRLMCGDSTDAGDVARLLDGAKPNLMVTDPPYGVDYDPAWRNAVADARGVVHSLRLGEVTNDDRSDWTDAWMLSPSEVAYVWHDGMQAGVVEAGLAAATFEVRAQIIWVKPKIAFGRGAYHWQHEPCWYAVRQGVTASWVGDRKQSTVWDIDHLNLKSRATEANPWTEHSTQKPVECMERPMRNHAGDVYEPFSGSGTTIIAAERQGRRCYAMEIEPKYVQVCIDRWEAFTGLKAERV